MSTRPLSKEIRRHRTRLVQCWRDGDIAIYEGKHGDEGGRKYWEVVRVREKRPTIFSGGEGEWDLVEIYPASEEWGIYGWTCKTLERGKEKARELLGACNSLEK